MGNFFGLYAGFSVFAGPRDGWFLLLTGRCLREAPLSQTGVLFIAPAQKSFSGRFTPFFFFLDLFFSHFSLGGIFSPKLFFFFSKKRIPVSPSNRDPPPLQPFPGSLDQPGIPLGNLPPLFPFLSCPPFFKDNDPAIRAPIFVSFPRKKKLPPSRRKRPFQLRWGPPPRPRPFDYRWLFSPRKLASFLWLDTPLYPR